VVPRVGFVKRLAYIGLTASRWQNQNRDRQIAALICCGTRAESLMSAPDPVAITLHALRAPVDPNQRLSDQKITGQYEYRARVLTISVRSATEVSAKKRAAGSSPAVSRQRSFHAGPAQRTIAVEAFVVWASEICPNLLGNHTSEYLQPKRSP
jgi:hypothetical protein